MPSVSFRGEAPNVQRARKRAEEEHRRKAALGPAEDQAVRPAGAIPAPVVPAEGAVVTTESESEGEGVFKNRQLGERGEPLRWTEELESLLEETLENYYFDFARSAKEFGRKVHAREPEKYYEVNPKVL